MSMFLFRWLEAAVFVVATCVRVGCVLLLFVPFRCPASASVFVALPVLF